MEVTLTNGNDTYQVSLSADPLTVNALAGNDAITLFPDAPSTTDTVYAGSGNDLITVTDSNGNGFADGSYSVVYGDAGNDLIDIFGGEGYGGDGNDRIVGDFTTYAEGGRGDDFITAVDTGHGGAGSDMVFAANTATGDVGDDIVSAEDAEGGSGSDEVYGASADGGDGNDLIHAGYEAFGDAGHDVFFLFDRLVPDDDGHFYIDTQTDFTHGEDRIASPIPLHSVDHFTGVAGQYMVNPDTGYTDVDLDGDGVGEVSLVDLPGPLTDADFVPIVFRGTDATETAHGSGLLVGEGGDDVLSGATGKDWLFGGFGNDVLSGASGDDLLVGNAGADRLLGGSGNDQLDGGDGNDVLSGSAGSDFASGGSGDDLISGGDGDDRLAGGEGDDHINGGAGNDTIVGGAGKDYMIGGSGADTFVFYAGQSGPSAGSRDTIADFQVGVDKIDLTTLDAGATFTIVHQAAHDLLEVDSHNTGTIDMAILVDTTGGTLTAGDVLL